MLSYDQANKQLGKRKSKKIAPNTYLVRGSNYISNEIDEYSPHIDGNPSIEVMFYNTPIVTIHIDGAFTLRLGGHLKRVTIKRINQFSPVNMSSDYTIHYPYPIEFREGMTVNSFGQDLDHLA